LPRWRVASASISWPGDRNEFENPTFDSVRFFLYYSAQISALSFNGGAGDVARGRLQCRGALHSSRRSDVRTLLKKDVGFRRVSGG
jgi:hypothetical protein